jgi:hypothetical protein
MVVLLMEYLSLEMNRTLIKEKNQNQMSQLMRKTAHQLRVYDNALYLFLLLVP